MALPHPSMAFTPFDVLTADEMNDLVDNIEALADGSGLNNLAITTAKIGAAAVTIAKIDLTSFQATAQVGSADVSGGASGVVVTTTNFSFVTGRKYLIIGKNRYAGSSDGGIWTLGLTVNGVALADSRLGGAAGIQFPSISQGVYTAAATASYVVRVVATRNSGSGTIAVEAPGILIIPLLN